MAAAAAAAGPLMGAVLGTPGDPLARRCERDGWVERHIDRPGPVERAAQSRVVKHTLIEHEPAQLLQPAHALRVSKVAGASQNPNAVLLGQSALAHVAEQ